MLKHLWTLETHRPAFRGIATVGAVGNSGAVRDQSTSGGGSDGNNMVNGGNFGVNDNNASASSSSSSSSSAGGGAMEVDNQQTDSVADQHSSLTQDMSEAYTNDDDDLYSTPAAAVGQTDTVQMSTEEVRSSPLCHVSMYDLSPLFFHHWYT